MKVSYKNLVLTLALMAASSPAFADSCASENINSESEMRDCLRRLTPPPALPNTANNRYEGINSEDLPTPDPAPVREPAQSGDILE